MGEPDAGAVKAAPKARRRLAKIASMDLSSGLFAAHHATGSPYPLIPAEAGTQTKPIHDDGQMRWRQSRRSGSRQNLGPRFRGDERWCGGTSEIGD
jgi:hypothetical protein